MMLSWRPRSDLADHGSAVAVGVAVNLRLPIDADAHGAPPFGP